MNLIHAGECRQCEQKGYPSSA